MSVEPHDKSMIEELDAYLSSDESPDDCMMLSDLDGFIHGIVCSPIAIEPQEWFPMALGGNIGCVPYWVIQSISKLYEKASLGLFNDRPEVEPIFWQAKAGHVIAMDWCEGFMQAVSLRPQDWHRLSESGSHGHLLTPIMVHMIDEQGNSAMGIPQEELDQTLEAAAEQIPDAVVGIYRFWRDVA